MFVPGIFESRQFKVATRVLPLTEPPVVLLDRLELAIREPEAFQVVVPFILPALATGDLCLAEPLSTELGFPIQPAHVADLTSWLNAQLRCPEPETIPLDVLSGKVAVQDLTGWLIGQFITPEIEDFPMALTKPRKEGKSYGNEREEIGQPSLFEDAGRCIHGLKKQSCATCIDKERQPRERTAPLTDLFDLILPILYPPLGANLDNPIAFPAGATLYPFQYHGVKFLAGHDRALLGDEMGLGKSIQTIIALRLLFQQGKVTSGIILCPKSVLTDWETKLWDWAPELALVKVSGSRDQREIQWNLPAHVYLATYETYRQDANGGIARKHFDYAVLDEVQKIKNPSAELTKTTRSINTSVRWGLSGTPLENSVDDVVSIFAYLKPGLLREGETSPSRVKTAIQPYFLRRRKVDALPELPEKVHEDVWLELLPRQRRSYDRAEQEGIVALNRQGELVTLQHVFALITKLKQICNLDSGSNESCKLEYLTEKLEAVSDQGDKALVFSQFPEKTLRNLEPELGDFKPGLYHGGLSDAQRSALVKNFQEREDMKVLLMSVKSGGLGLTLTRANYVFHFDLWWNPSTASQAEDRAHRIGQEKTVFVTYLYTRGTIEERIKRLLDNKRELFRAVIDDLSDTTDLKRVLTEEEIFGLFNLKKPRQPMGMRDHTPGANSSDTLAGVSPWQFEEIVAKLYGQMGYSVRRTQQTRDGGIDLFARKFSENGSELLAIQCKHYPNGLVGPEPVRALYGVIQADPSITKGLLITSGEFSRDARNFAQGKRIELFDGNYTRGLLEKYNVT